MKKLISATLFLLALSSAALATERFAPAPGSTVTIKGTSTLHEWSMQGSTINGQIAVADDWKTTGLAESLVDVSIPVTSLKSDHARMDRLMSDALKSKANPAITYRMTGATLQRVSTAHTTGKLTIAGVTRDVTMDVSMSRDNDSQYVLTGTTPIRMSDYGVTPPVTMMGTLRTGNDVTVTFRWVVTTPK